MRGRTPEPNRLKILKGVRANRLNGPDAVFPVSGTDPPSWLRGFALDHWHELAPDLVRAGILTVVDRPALAVLCELWGRIRPDPDDPRAKVPYLKWSTEFGLPPASRHRVSAAATPFPDDLDIFL